MFRKPAKVATNPNQRPTGQVRWVSTMIGDLWNVEDWTFVQKTNTTECSGTTPLGRGTGGQDNPSLSVTPTTLKQNKVSSSQKNITSPKLCSQMVVIEIVKQAGQSHNSVWRFSTEWHASTELTHNICPNWGSQKSDQTRVSPRWKSGQNEQAASEGCCCGASSRSAEQDVLKRNEWLLCGAQGS